MGGHEAGEVASRLAIEAITGFIRRSAADTDFSWPYGLDGTLSYDGNRLRTAIHLANRRIFRAAESNDDYSGMGTTIVGVLANGTTVAIGHVGDSRLYLLRRGALEQLTQDDSWAATILAHDPRVKPADLAHHPMRNVLTNVLGAREQVDVHLVERELENGDVILLCSDGLHGVLDQNALGAILKTETDVQAASRALVAAALENGARDNVTALVVRYEAGA
jgi:protein phosphatase